VGDAALPPFWHSPQSIQGIEATKDAYKDDEVRARRAEGLSTSSYVAIYRQFVDEAPSIQLNEPTSGSITIAEDTAGFASFIVSHKAADQYVDRPLVVTLNVSNGIVRTVSHASVVLRESDGSIMYRAMLEDINNMLAQIEYVPRANWYGSDLLAVTVTDLEYNVSIAVPIVVQSIDDPPTIVCPAGIDLDEGQQGIPVGTEITVRDNDQFPGVSDTDVQVIVTLSVGGGGLTVGEGQTSGLITHTPMNMIEFNSSLGEARDVFSTLAFSSAPPLFHGVVQLKVHVTMVNTLLAASCSVGLIVHPVNTPPAITINNTALSLVQPAPDQDVLLGAIYQFSDPDEQVYSDWFTRRMHHLGLTLNVTCGRLSLGFPTNHDYVQGSQMPSIAGTEGIGFNAGDGYLDEHLEIESTLKNMNKQMHRVHYNSLGCSDIDVVLSVLLDDRGNYGKGGPKTDRKSVTFRVSP
jgi:hypothetical protein